MAAHVTTTGTGAAPGARIDAPAMARIGTAPEARPVLTAVIPVYNEEDVLAELHRRVVAALEAIGETFEVVLVNDGSADRSAPMLDEICALDPRFRVVHFARNFGHQAAVTAGLRYSAGQCVVVLDADLQDPPELIRAMLERWREGYEVVYAQRLVRQREGPVKRLTAYFFYRLLSRLTEVPIPKDTGDFCLMDRRVVEVLNAMPERNRFVRGLRVWVGFRQTAVPFERPPRHAGEVKYTYAKLLVLALNGIFSMSVAPLRLATYFGLIVSGASFVLAVAFVIAKLMGGVDVQGWASLIVVILFLGGVQLLTIGIIGEYISRIFDEVRQRPAYVVRDARGFAPGEVDL